MNKRLLEGLRGLQRGCLLLQLLLLRLVNLNVATYHSASSMNECFCSNLVVVGVDILTSTVLVSLSNSEALPGRGFLLLLLLLQQAAVNAIIVVM